MPYIEPRVRCADSLKGLKHFLDHRDFTFLPQINPENKIEDVAVPWIGIIARRCLQGVHQAGDVSMMPANHGEDVVEIVRMPQMIRQRTVILVGIAAVDLKAILGSDRLECLDWTLAVFRDRGGEKELRFATESLGDVIDEALRA